MKRIPIRLKVAGSLALPLLALMVVSTFEVRQAGRDAAAVRAETDLATALSGPAGVISRLQDERNWAVLELTGLDESFGSVTVQGYDETRAATDEAVQAFRDDVQSKGGAVSETFEDAVAAVDELESIRADIDGYEGPKTLDNVPFSNGIYQRFADLISGLSEANARVVGQVDDTELRQGTDLAVLASKQFENEAALNREIAAAAMMSPGGIDTRDEIRLISSVLALFSRTNRQIEGAEGVYADIVDERLPREYSTQMQGFAQTAIETHMIADFDAFMELIARPPEDGFRGLRDAFIAEVVRRADVLNADAVARQRQFTLLAVVAFGVAAAIAWMIARSITNPMRLLTRQAQDVANHRLPGAVREILETPPGEDVRLAPLAKVEVPTRDEVAEVVVALNTVQDSALQLAVEQAVLRRNVADSFVNMARRNQGLLSRQIDFITELETSETDPDALSGLFRLDHLATRMRRNAESLLVLAGTSPQRRLSAPVPITDVIRGTLGEIEDYQRVTVEEVAPATVRGWVAADLAHLLAELLENALAYSPPGEPAVVLGRWRGRDTYRVTIVDQGMGMAPAEIAQANRRLAGSESSMVAPSKYLGQHVAGTLAARHGMRIVLEAGALGGIVATVDLPAGVVDPIMADPTRDSGSQPVSF